MKRVAIATALTVLFAGSAAMGSGMLIPKDESIPPLAIKSQRVDIQIKDGAATAKIEQIFKNSVDRDLEATYYFPLPEDASIAEFAMYIGGKRMTGELVEKGKASRIYQDIVRRMKDPGLLEHLYGNMFKVSVFPVPRKGEQRIEISYSQTLQSDGGLYRFVYPLKTSEASSRTLEDFTVRAKINSNVPVKNVYSPSHKVGITRKSDNDVTVGFEEDKAILDRDFVLYYGLSKKDFGLNLLSHAPAGQDGFFMMMLAPSVQPPKGEAIKRDVTFVFDCSGSMAGDKIKQSREALKYCIKKLNADDRFGIIRFNTDVEKFGDKLTDVSDKSREAGIKFVDEMEARGGTDIQGALAAALSVDRDQTRTHTIVFMTDGKPTIGETEPNNILEKINKANTKNTRIFVFGVGHDVNTHLLDKLAGGNGGVSQYVEPNEDIEVKVSSFYDKISLPVLTSPKITVDKLAVKQMHPQKLTDIFAGSQITLFGRYTGGGHVAVKLSGEVNGKPQEYVYEETFPEKNTENDFIPRLWATRRVGFLLEQIRLNSKEGELKDEVVRLGKEHGIMTPYTSYLVLESEKDYQAHGIDRRVDGAKKPEAPAEMAQTEARWTHAKKSASTGASRPRIAERDTDAASPAAQQPAPVREAVPMFGGNDDAVAMDVAGVATAGEGGAGGRVAREPAMRRQYAADKEKLDGYFRKESGANAVELSKAIEDYKSRDVSDQTIAPAVKHVGKKIFYLINGVWVDRDYKKGLKETKVKYASDEYFAMLEKNPDLRKYLALGQKVVVCLDNESAVIVEGE